MNINIRKEMKEMIECLNCFFVFKVKSEILDNGDWVCPECGCCDFKEVKEDWNLE